MAVSQNLTITQVSQSVANRTSTIRILWTTTQTGTSYNNYTKTGYYWISVNGGTEVKHTVTSTLPKQSTKTIVDTTLIVEHNSSGECVVNVRTSMATGISAGTVTLSESLTLDTIHQASTLTAGNGTLGTAQTLTITRHSSNFTHSIKYECGTASGAVYTKGSGTSLSFTPPIGLARQNTTGNTVSVKLILYTFDGDTEIGQTAKTITCTIPNTVKPSCSISYEEVGTNHLQRYGAFIQGQTRLRVTITPELAYDSPIIAYTSTANGSRYSSSTYTTGVLKDSGGMAIYAAVTDSRNRSGTAEIYIDEDIYGYSPPAITSLSVHRCDVNGAENDQGEYCSVSFAGNVSPIAEGMNFSSYELWYRKSGEEQYTVVSLPLDDRFGEISYTCEPFRADSGSPYDVVIAVSDDFYNESKNNIITRSTSVSTAETIMHISADGTTVCFGGISTRQNAHQIRKPIYDKFDKLICNGVAVYTGSGDDAIDPNTTTEELVLTNKYTPISGQFMYIRTMFYNQKSATANRAQIAVPYKVEGRLYYRFFFDGEWSYWFPVGGADYVTQNGTTTNGGFSWNWTIWSSGRVEMWGTGSVTPESTATGGNTFYSSEFKLTIPVSVSSGIVTGTANLQAWISNTSVSGTTLKFRIGRGQTISTSTAVEVQLRVDGKQ